jgi:hypothetical protein
MKGGVGCAMDLSQDWFDSIAPPDTGSADKKRRGTDQGTVIDLPDKEVCDVGATDEPEPPVL